MEVGEIEFLRIGEAAFLRDPARHYWVVEAIPKSEAWRRFLAVREVYPLARVLVSFDGVAIAIDGVARWNAGVVLTKVPERGDAEEFARRPGVEIREWWFLPERPADRPVGGRHEGEDDTR
jgi:hypothetical protein